jgi:hypothetical protein
MPACAGMTNLNKAEGLSSSRAERSNLLDPAFNPRHCQLNEIAASLRDSQ